MTNPAHACTSQKQPELQRNWNMHGVEESRDYGIWHDVMDIMTNAKLNLLHTTPLTPHCLI